jgi:neutral ceramidase
MKIRSAILILAGFVLLPGSSFAGVLKTGAAISNITPPRGIAIVGNWGEETAVNVHDELHARAIVLDDGGRKVALVVCDLLGLPVEVCNQARKLVSEKTGIPEGNVMISVTHTHSAGTALGENADLSAYQKHVVSRLTDAVVMANGRLRPSEMTFGRVDIPDHVFNRRWSLKEGKMPLNPFGKVDKAQMNPAQGSPNLVEPVGPTDPSVSFIAFREPGGRLTSLFAAYSLHYVGGVKFGDISSDYFGVFCDELKRRQPVADDGTAPPFMAMLANGTSGDINSINFRTPPPPEGSYKKMQRIGVDVADKIDNAIKAAKWESEISLDAKFKVLTIPRRTVSPELKAWAEETSKKEVPKGQVDLPYIYSRRVLNSLKYEQTMSVPLQYLRIGNVGIGTMPVEVFAETGLDFKKKAPLANSFMVSMAHGFLGYLPPARHFDLGGYETWPGTSQLSAGAEAVMLKELLEMAETAKSPN